MVRPTLQRSFSFCRFSFLSLPNNRRNSAPAASRKVCRYTEKAPSRMPFVFRPKPKLRAKQTQTFSLWSHLYFLFFLLGVWGYFLVFLFFFSHFLLNLNLIEIKLLSLLETASAADLSAADAVS